MSYPVHGHPAISMLSTSISPEFRAKISIYPIHVEDVCHTHLTGGGIFQALTTEIKGSFAVKFSREQN